MSHGAWRDISFVMNTRDISTNKTIAHVYKNKYSINVLDLCNVLSDTEYHKVAVVPQENISVATCSCGNKEIRTVLLDNTFKDNALPLSRSFDQLIHIYIVILPAIRATV